MKKILLIEDDIAFCKMVSNFLSKNNYNVSTAYSANEARTLVKDTDFDLIMCDIRLPDSDGIELMAEFKLINPTIPIVLMTGYADVTTAVKAMKRGASDYISKPFVPEEVLLVLSNALNKPAEKKTGAPATHTTKSVQKERDFVSGISAVSKTLLTHIQLVSPTNLSVLINGESGTGKEVVAKEVHKLSNRNKAPFIAVDCGAIPKELATSEFFGHLKGSFTGAVTDKIGHFESANGGTLFLDEVGNLSYENQIQLLRALQERKVKKIGSSTEVEVDIRVIAATNEDLKEGVKNGTFREDLYHRLNEFSIEVPTLEERKQDLLMYADFFLDKANEQLNKNVLGFSPDVIRIFQAYSWPGNLRELQNIIRRSALLTQGNLIEKDVLPADLFEEQSKSMGGLSKSENEKEMIIKALKLCNGNKSEAAKMLEINRKTLYNKLKLYQLEED
ncbi:sigma-54 dependent transcriptional regulator [Flavobacterium azooxidireducens]|uniref:Sigma-54 dependent transcriptional regulator n=1 Tax=Flavobacterium azooxidireducens TaxID=1871076 RepID=A0ABY4KLN7_9FLAO|nr:sigma-54 dependent transcriptional regulator [Flavobacterium azooxidireducens]UPQ80698.1 sigma-54 dependent transcriptional regulator [Flavobacterium azooxidireducens]